MSNLIVSNLIVSNLKMLKNVLEICSAQTRFHTPEIVAQMIGLGESSTVTIIVQIGEGRD